MIYADHAATTKLSEDALLAMIPWLTNEYGNPSQPYSFSRKPKQAIAEARKTIATCINASPDEIYFTSGGTESDNWAIKGTLFSNLGYKSIMTSAFEHHAVLNACKVLERFGYPVTYLMPDKTGRITTESFKHNITNKNSLVSIMYANNELGTM